MWGFVRVEEASMTHHPARRRIATLFAVTIVALMLIAAPGWADVNFTSGGAFGEKVDVAPAGIHVTSGPKPAVILPATGGGPFADNLAVVDLPGVLRVGLLEVSTQGALGAAGFAQSSADVANVLVGPADSPILTAQAVHSACRSNSAGSTGSTSLTN